MLFVFLFSPRHNKSEGHPPKNILVVTLVCVLALVLALGLVPKQNETLGCTWQHVYTFHVAQAT